MKTFEHIKNDYLVGLENHSITYWEDRADHSTGLQIFECWAEDEEHAKEQLFDSEPNAEISTINGRG